MAKTYRTGVIGFAHMHINELMRSFGEVPNVEWVACADTKPLRPERVEARFTREWNRRHAHETIGIPKVYDDYREMLDKERFDLVFFCPENSRHGEVAEAIAAHGAHMVTEKPMAATMPEALRMARAARAAGVLLAVNWPTTWSSAVRTAHRLVREGAIGQLWEVKWRAGSMGPLSHGSTHPGVGGQAVEMSDVEKGATWWHQEATGGGALLDYTCYGACLSRWFIGEPATAAFGLKANLLTPYGDADDNAIITVRFPKAVAILEATWSCVDHGVATGPLLYGSTGTIVVERQGEHQVATLRRGRGSEPETAALDTLPQGRHTLGRDVINHLETGEPLHETLQTEFNLEAMGILDAGIRSARSGQLELVNGAQWSLGL
ncbi:MAG: Gfo/Idh/MocA family oxidoreductase [Chloroflexota bacterium]|nr:Gfo/Idh/MocA family oxidoreductase [Chloroflexota bacterium]